MLHLWHGSTRFTTALRPGSTQDGGLHVGTREQASMRNSAVLYLVHASPNRIRRCRDRGGDWESRIRDARARGFDAIRYLNRYEGVPATRIEQLAEAGQLADLDGLTDKEFARLVPEARDSYILLREDVFEIRHIELRKIGVSPWAAA